MASNHTRGAPAAQKTPGRQAPETEATSRPSRERIEIQAYELYRARSERGDPGGPLDDWLQAEREIQGGAGGAGP